MKKYLSLTMFFCLVWCLSAESSSSSHVFTAPPSIPADIIDHINQNKAVFISELQHVLASDRYDLLILVDKKHPLPKGYIPADIVPLSPKCAYKMNRMDLSLTRPAENALRLMAEAAREDGVTLVVSSSYRPYTYQEALFNRYVRESGEKEAERFSARAGTSQHQLGTVVDFGSITDEFAETRAGKWVLHHAGEYGWSLSFPKGYESVTGYIWESWHYRYIGIEACALEKKWFGGIQQYMLEFIAAWKKAAY